MTPRAIDIKLRRQPRSVIIDLGGEINADAEQPLQTAYAEADAQDCDVILLNFSRVAYINSTGIALIVGLLARARARHRQLIAYGLSDHYVEIFNITRLSDYLAIFPDETSALQAPTLSPS